jgi:hypothetical protein
MIQKRENKMFVQLSSSIDAMHYMQMSRNEKIEELQKPNGTFFFEIESLKHGVKLCLDFISEFSLGSSNWMGGLVVDDNFNFVAHISYNGRIWDNTEENWEIAKEISLC